MKKTVHIINSLGFGGAERMLQKISREKEFQEQDFFTILGAEKIGKEMVESGVKVTALEVKKRPFNIIKLFQNRPEIIVAWLYHSCLLAAAYKILFPKTKIVWNIRHSLHDVTKEKMGIRIVLWAMEKLRFLADAVIFNSYVSKDQHLFLIDQKTKSAVIPNGFEAEKFIPSVKTSRCIGIFARFHPMKGHVFFLETFAEIKDVFPDWIIRFVGEGCSEDNRLLAEAISRLKLHDRVFLEGPKLKMEDEYSKIDMLVISSLWGEAFPNVLGEAMLCEKICIASDIGDSPIILNDPRWIFQHGDKTDLKNKLVDALSLDANELKTIGEYNRLRVISNYTISSVSKSLANFIEGL